MKLFEGFDCVGYILSQWIMYRAPVEKREDRLLVTLLCRLADMSVAFKREDGSQSF